MPTTATSARTDSPAGTRLGWDAAVIGLGYVGLPLAREATTAGLRVVGIDTDPGKVEGLNAGRSHIGDLTDAEVARLLTLGFRATADARETPAIPVVRRLRALGALVSYADPFLAQWQVDASPVHRVDLGPGSTAANEADVCVLLQDHAGFDLEQLSGTARLVLDTRGVLPAAANVQRL